MSLPAHAMDALLRPRSIAVIGASTEPLKVGGVPVKLLREYGYAGRILPVHREAREIQGLPAVPSLAALGSAPDSAPDMAIVCVPRAGAVRALEDCAAAGVRAAVVFTGGFAEADAEGAAAQAELARIARAAGMALLGPNCLGAISFAARTFATFTPAALAGQPPVGTIGLVSQSGAFGAYAYALARKHAVGLSHWVTTGNEAGLQVADVIEWFAHDPDTRVILAYLEGCRDGARLMRALRAARDAGKPVVITKVGRTPAGARAALSHTASMAGEDAVFDAVFDECGAVRAHDVESFFRAGLALARLPVPRNDAIAIVTGSGGVGTMMADAAEDHGLALPPFTAAEAARLHAVLPLATSGNPIDVTGQIVANPQALVTTCEIAAESGRYGGVALFVAAAGGSPRFGPAIEACGRLPQRYPGLAVMIAGVLSDAQREQLGQHGCLVYEEPTHAIEAFALLRRVARAREAGREPVAPVAPIDALPIGTFNEADALAFLARHGVPVVAHGVARTAAEAAALAGEWNGPVAVKILSADIAHKSDVGGVLLNVQGVAAVAAAFTQVMENAARHAPQARVDGVLVARMLRPVVECVVGARTDPVFGPVLTFGLGGTEVEWLKRVALATAPVTPGRVRALLERLDLPRRIDGWRGGPRIALEPLIEAICAVGRLAAAAGPRLESIEINPLIVTADGVHAADALLQFH